MLEEAVAPRAKGVEQHRDGFLVAEATQRGRGFAPDVGRFVLEAVQQGGKRGAVELQPGGVGGRDANSRIQVVDRVPGRNAAPRKRPHGVSPDADGRAVQRCGIGARVDRAVADGETGIAEQVRVRLLPGDLQPARILDFRRILAADAIDAALDLRLVDARRRAADAEPAARVDHDEASVGVLEDVGRVEIGIGGDEELLGAAAEGRPVPLDSVALDLVGVELGGEEVVDVVLPERAAAVAHQAGGRDPAHVDHRGQQIARALEFADALVVGEDSAFDRVEDDVDALRRREEERAGGERLAFLGERDLHGIVHAAAADDLDLRSVGPAAEHSRGAALHPRPVGAVDRMSMAPVGPVEPAVGAEERSVDVGGVAARSEFRDDLLALHAAVGLGEFPDARGRADERAAVPQRAHREGEFVGEDDALVERAVAVGVLEADHPMGRPLQEIFEPQVDAGGIADVEAAALVEARHDRPLDERRAGDLLDDESLGNLDLRVVLGRQRGETGDQ